MLPGRRCNVRPQSRRNVAIWAQGLRVRFVPASLVSTISRPPMIPSSPRRSHVSWGWSQRGRTLDTSMGFRSRSDPGSRSSLGHVALSLGLGLQSSRMLLSCVTSAALRAPPSCVSSCVLASYPSQWFFLAPFVAHEHVRSTLCCA